MFLGIFLRWPSQATHAIGRFAKEFIGRAYGEDLFERENPWVARLTGVGLPLRRKMKRKPWMWAAVLLPSSALWALASNFFVDPFGPVGNIGKTWMACQLSAILAIAALGAYCGIESRDNLRHDRLFSDSLVTPMPLRKALAGIRARVALWSAIFGLVFLLLFWGMCATLAGHSEHFREGDWIVIALCLLMAPALALNYAAGVFHRASSLAVVARDATSFCMGLVNAAMAFPLLVLRMLGIVVVSCFLFLSLLAIAYWIFLAMENEFRMLAFYGKYWFPVCLLAIPVLELRIARDRLTSARILWTDFFCQGDSADRSGEWIL